MKQFYLILGLLAGIVWPHQNAQAQDAKTTSPVLRIYEDDDFFNIRGIGTDEGYTNGSRIDYFYAKRHRDRLADRWLMPSAGRGSVNTYEWGIMEVMYTPNNLKIKDYMPNNYPYSGALFLVHDKLSYNPVTKLSFQTELVMGVMGPIAAAGPIQSWFHGLIHYQKPMGWNNQLPNDLLLNEDLTVEKEILHVGRGLEWFAGTTGYFGTMLDGGAVYSTVRVGWMNPYFDGWAAQFQGKKPRKMDVWAGPRHGAPRRAQFYIFGSPRAEWTAYNALLEGGVLSKTLNHNDVAKIDGYADNLKRGVAEIDYGWVIVYRGITASYTQKTASATMKGMGMHEVGNLAFLFTLH
ncbi:lipid A-modifier LpxR family protein [Dinghuibacter silviterrae]|uniref:Uncharacterized protein DUF2219 n=1 Tax=Dinghuibacter silviterrae TaxID=1539049 RepID=A0A4R8DW82_9BACT|nr:lipid A-modifier LpxR family protein [Dinghuibacter silviterrae]TDX01667.1 uncharacterized protein DUF2219 [Dinghuibacter silviterrae]